MEFYYMVNYYFKYLELLDTVFLALKKKTLGEITSHSRLRSFLIKRQLSSTFSTTPPPLCYVIRNSMERPA